VLLNTQLADGTDLFLDCETSGGFDKDQARLDFHPDDAAKNVVKIAAAVAKELRAVSDAAGTDTTLEVEFSVKVDSQAVVTVGRNAADGQFKIRLRYG
jgi:hypothetical protein